MSRRPTLLDEIDARKDWLKQRLEEKIQAERERHQLRLVCEGWSLQAAKGEGPGAFALEMYQASQERWGNPGSSSKGGRRRSAEPEFVSWYTSSPPTWADGENQRPVQSRRVDVDCREGSIGGKDENGDSA